MLQLWRARPPCQRMPVAPSAQKVSLLPECVPHGGQLSGQSTAAAAAPLVSRLSGNSSLTEAWGGGGGGGGAQPGRPMKPQSFREDGGFFTGTPLTCYLRFYLLSGKTESSHEYRCDDSVFWGGLFWHFFSDLDKCLSFGMKQSDLLLIQSCVAATSSMFGLIGHDTCQHKSLTGWKPSKTV